MSELFSGKDKPSDKAKARLIEEKGKKRPGGKRARVRVIRVDKDGALVEWDINGLKRGFIEGKSLSHEADGDYAPTAELKTAKPFGTAFTEYLQLTISVDAIIDRLHLVGIWTAKDAYEQSNKTKGAFSAVLNDDIIAFINEMGRKLKES